MDVSYHRPTFVEINLDAITHNIRFFKQRLSSNTEIMAVVKADAYGHGAVQIVKHLKSLSVKYFAVAFLDEAIQLRNAGIEDSILVLGYTPVHSIKVAFEHNIAVTVFTKEVIDEIHSIGNKLKKKLRVHIKLDTGMGRIGVSPEELYDLFHVAKKSPWIEVEGIFSHFASADEKDKSQTLKQYKLFRSELDKIIADHEVPFIHISNSAAMIDLPELNQDITRLGISMYGLLPSREVKINEHDLRPAMTLKSEIAYLKTIKPGQTVSYGATFKAERDTVVATIPIGYADGLLRQLSNKGQVLVNGNRVPIIGRVCMDQTMLDVTDYVDQVKVGDEVVLFGTQMGTELSVDEHAKLVGTINYELVTLIGRRVPRVFIKNGKIIDVLNNLL